MEKYSVLTIITSPTLNSVTGQSVDNNFTITFTDNATWRAAVTEVDVDGSSIGSNYTLSSGSLVLTTSAITTLQTIRQHTVVVKAIGYSNATVSKQM